ncbi:hypothetical protein SAMD00079811_77900 (plasmid) [Scytonema sp. HK-05]|nr:hypothetical protein NIES2130_09170 [Scytonema sp. HK-05]BAY50161.1 hypothetical protein SAMD00079811_77900 [Scytonema sp. HK-05]
MNDLLLVCIGTWFPIKHNYRWNLVQQRKEARVGAGLKILFITNDDLGEPTPTCSIIQENCYNLKFIT